MANVDNPYNWRAYFEFMVPITTRHEAPVFIGQADYGYSPLKIATHLSIAYDTSDDFYIDNLPVEFILMNPPRDLEFSMFYRGDEIWYRNEFGEGLAINKVRVRMLKEIYEKEI